MSRESSTLIIWAVSLIVLICSSCTENYNRDDLYPILCYTFSSVAAKQIMFLVKLLSNVFWSINTPIVFTKTSLINSLKQNVNKSQLILCNSQ